MSPGAQRRTARVYEDPEEALSRMDRISWSVPNVPTPFVGSGPRPGVAVGATINSLQFRTADELEIPKPPGTYRIFITGGSTAYGSGTPGDDRTIGAYLEAILNESGNDAPRYEVWTLANPSWTTTHERILIENRLPEFAPDLVISFSGNNDVHWGIRGSNILWSRTYQESSYWSLLQIAYDLAGSGPLPDVADVGRGPVPTGLVAERLVRNVRLSAYSLSLESIVYVFALQPTRAVAEDAAGNVTDETATEEQAYFIDSYARIRDGLETISAPNFHYFDTSGVFGRERAPSEYFVDSYHFGDKGYEVIARDLAADLLGSVLAPVATR